MNTGAPKRAVIAAAESGVCGQSERPKVSANKSKIAPIIPESRSMVLCLGPIKSRAQCGAMSPTKATCPTKQVAAAAAKAVNNIPLRRTEFTSSPRVCATSSPNDN